MYGERLLSFPERTIGAVKGDATAHPPIAFVLLMAPSPFTYL
jgi:hypothetical protein